MKSLPRQFVDTAKIIILALVLAAGLQYVTAATSWAPAAGAPPGNNTYAPINVGAVGQTKSGGITVGTGNPSVGFQVSGGAVRFTSPTLGTPSSGYVLKSDGTGNVTWQPDAQGSGGTSGGVTCGPTTCGVNELAKFTSSNTIASSNLFAGGGGLGIGVVSPTASLDVNGQIRLRGGNPGPGKVLVSSGDGTASWGAASGGATFNQSSCAYTDVPSCSSVQQLVCPVGKYMAGMKLTNGVACSGDDNNIKLQAYCCNP